MKGPLHAQKWMEGFSAPPTVVDRSHHCYRSGRKVLPLHLKLPEGLVDAPEVDKRSRQSARYAAIVPKVHQKCYCHTRSASRKPEVLPPNRRCFRQTGSTFPILEVHLNCLRQTGDAPKVLPLNRKCTKSASAEPEVHQMCVCHQLSVHPRNFPSTFRAAMGLYIKLFQLSLRPGTICKLPSTFCAAVRPSLMLFQLFLQPANFCQLSVYPCDLPSISARQHDLSSIYMNLPCVCGKFSQFSVSVGPS